RHTRGRIVFLPRRDPPLRPAGPPGGLTTRAGECGPSARDVRPAWKRRMRAKVEAVGSGDSRSRKEREKAMKALVYHGPGKKSWEEVPDPQIINGTDAIVQIDTTTICGTDLHILQGHVQSVEPGRILGHAGVGTITEVGEAGTSLKVGDRVIVSCVCACGTCSYCHEQLPSHCLADEGGSWVWWIFGHLID